MTAIDRLKLALAAMDATYGVNHWWKRCYGLPDRTTANDAWNHLRDTAQPIVTDKPQRGKRAA